MCSDAPQVVRAAGIPHVIPGITAALGAPSYPLTDRRYARRLEFVTGHSIGATRARLGSTRGPTVF